MIDLPGDRDEVVTTGDLRMIDWPLRWLDHPPPRGQRREMTSRDRGPSIAR
jgi:hypothetical protein